MQIIRDKRQSGRRGAAPEQPKRKYLRVSDFHLLLRCELMNCPAGDSTWKVPLMYYTGDNQVASWP